MSDPTQDPDFMAASPSDQMKYLSQTDPDFAKANPVDQLGYIAHIRGVSPVQGIQPPAQPQMQGSVLGASNPSAGNDTPVGKIPSSISNRTPDWTDNVVGGAALGGAALMGGAAIPGGTAAMSRLGKAAVSAGGTMAGITAMDWAMNNIPGLKNLPAGVKAAADYIPLFVGHGNAPPYAGKNPAPNPSYPGASLPSREGFEWAQEQAAAKVQEQAPSQAPTVMSNGALTSLANPIGQGAKDLQPLAKASSRITHDAYDPQAQVATVRFPNGQVTEYHGISPQNWADYKNSASAGQGLEQNIINKAAAMRSMPRVTQGQKAAQALNKR